MSIDMICQKFYKGEVNMGKYNSVSKSGNAFPTNMVTHFRLIAGNLLPTNNISVESLRKKEGSGTCTLKCARSLQPAVSDLVAFSPLKCNFCFALLIKDKFIFNYKITYN